MGLLRLLLPLLVLGLIVWAIRRAVRSEAPTGCATCRHCRKLFDDGTLCGFGPREVFKNEVHVRNCTDYERRAS